MAKQICFLRHLILSFVALGYFCCCQADQDWTQFLGPDGTSEANHSTPPIKFNANNYIWETAIPGTGWSSPVYADNRIWLTSAVVEPATAEQIEEKRKGVQFADIKTSAGSIELRAVCIDLETGKLLHDISLRDVDDPDLINPMNSYASPTAVIADGKVVCHFGSYGTWCLDSASGKKIWQTQLVVDHSVGPGSSPVIYNDKVILVCDGIDKQFVAAISMADGSEVWKTPRPPMRNDNGEFQKAYSTPLIIDAGGKPQAVIPGAQWIVSYDPENGKELWKADHGSGFSTTPMASFENNMVIFATGFMRSEVLAVNALGAGDVTKTHIKWRSKNGPTMPSMLSFNDETYYLSDKGILHCVDIKTGETLNRKRIGGNFSASPLLANGNIYLSSREGKVTVVKADRSLEVIATNSFNEPIMASPAPFRNDLIFRVGGKLIRIGNTAG